MVIRCVRSLRTRELKTCSSSRCSCFTCGKVRAVCDLHAAGCDVEGLKQRCHDLLTVSVLLPLANVWTDRILRISSSGEAQSYFLLIEAFFSVTFRIVEKNSFFS